MMMRIILLVLLLNIEGLSASVSGSNVFKGEGADDIAWMNMLTMVAVGAAARGMSACKTTSSDALAASAAGGVYLWGEISTLQSSKGMEAQSYTYNYNENGTLIDSDKVALTAMRKNYVDARANLTTKKNMQKYAGLGFAGSGVWAGYKHHTLSKKREQCESDLGQALSACEKELVPSVAGSVTTGALPDPSGATKVAEYAKMQDAAASLPRIAKIEEQIEFSTDHSDKLQKSVDEFLANIKNNTLKCKTLAETSCSDFVVDYKKGLNRCTDAMKKESQNNDIKMDSSPAQEPAVTENMVREYFRLKGMPGFYDEVLDHLVKRESVGVLKLDAYISFFTDLIIPSSYAGFTQLLGLAGVGVGVFTGLKAEKTMFIDKYLSTYKNRAYVFGAMSLLAFSASSETAGQIAKIDSNIRKIDSILNSIGGGSGSAGSYGSGGSSYYDSTYNPYNTPITIPPSKVELPCATPDCKPISETIDAQLENDPDLQKLANIPESKPIIQSIKNTAALADDMKSKNQLSKGSLSKLNEVGNQKNALSKALTGLERKLNEDKGSAAAPIKLSGDPMLARELGSNRYTGKGGTIVASESPVLANVNPDASKGGKKDVSVNMSNDVFYMPPVNTNKRDTKEEQENVVEEVSLDLDDADLASEVALAKYSNSEAELASADGPSLWTLITNRYLKTATEKLLIPKDEFNPDIPAKKGKK